MSARLPLPSHLFLVAALASCSSKDDRDVEPGAPVAPDATEGDDSLWSLYGDPGAALGDEASYCGSQEGVASYAGPTDRLILPISLHTVVRGDGSGGLSGPALLPEVAAAEDLWAGSELTLDVTAEVEIVQSDLYYDLAFDERADYESLFAAHNVPGSLNVYYVNSVVDLTTGTGRPLSGFAILPFFGAGPEDRAIVVTYTSDEATLAHEIGHFLGLLHTHETELGLDDGIADCWSAGDQLCDTPPDPGTGTCSQAADCVSVSCEDGAFAPDPQNLMSYYHGCRDGFSAHQIGRARCFLERGVVQIDVPETPLCVDADGDGYGEGTDCLGPDCDDTDLLSNDAAIEWCDGADNDCDGSIDEGVQQTWYLDADGDGHGDPTLAYSQCAGGPGLVATGDDCDDLLGDVFPGAPELCNLRDDNCDLIEDEGFDADFDQFTVCGPTPDCDDTSPYVFPGALEICEDLRDQDCDGGDAACLADCLDGDGDGYGVGNGCRGADCDDSNGYVAPGAFETCDAPAKLDQNCNGQSDADEGLTQDFFLDGDGDTYGTTATVVNDCAPPPGYVLNSVDCDDASDDRYPGAPETCNNLDDSCDGVADEGLDADGDGFTPCELPTADCDDTTSAVFPGYFEDICDGLDNDCDGSADPGCGVRLAIADLLVGPDSSAVVVVPIPAGSLAHVAFLAPHTVVEHPTDRCDFVTSIVQQGDTVEFQVTTSGCGIDILPAPVAAFAAQAVVVAHTGGDGWVASTRLDYDTNRSDVLAIPASPATEAFAFAAWHSFDDDGDQNDTGRVCTITADWPALQVAGDLSMEDQNQNAHWSVDVVGLGLGANLSGDLVDFSCPMETSIQVQHLLGTGTDHAAIVLPRSALNGDSKNHGSWSTHCVDTGIAYECTIDCKGSQDRLEGSVLFLDGDFLQ